MSISLASRMWSAGWAPLSVVLIHSALSAAIGHRREYDPVFHFTGGAAGAFCVVQSLRVFRAELGRVARLNPVLVVLIVMVGAIGAWEVAEFTSDRFFGTHIQRGVEDTGMDILLGVAGILV